MVKTDVVTLVLHHEQRLLLRGDFLERIVERILLHIKNQTILKSAIGLDINVLRFGAKIEDATRKARL
jgi:hypothetical protein